MRITVEAGCASPVRICAACKWVEEDSSPWCQNPRAMIVDRVTGKRTPEYSCNYHRNGESRPFCWFNGTCGNIGRWWEPKDA